MYAAIWANYVASYTVSDCQVICYRLATAI